MAERSAPLLLLATFYLLLAQTDVLMVGAIVGTESAGIYTAASRLAGFVQFGAIATNLVAAPLIARLHAADERHQLQNLLQKSARSIFVIAVPSSLALLIGSGFLLRMFGDQFVVARATLAVLIIGQLFGCLGGSAGYLMTLTGHQRAAAKIVGIVAVFNIASTLCSSRFGARWRRRPSPRSPTAPPICSCCSMSGATWGG